ncbi:MAG: tellurium resistance protein TerC [Planctomycetota bacterium]|nr:tellurium resistance protein TerC [Planctomycetota bacterium]
MELFSVEGLLALLMLILLQAVLGFDNLLYISLESKRVEPGSQAMVRKWGIGIAIALRLVLLYVLVELIGLLQGAFWSVDTHAIHFELSGHALIVLLGGAFIVYMAIKEIFHMLAPAQVGVDLAGGRKSSVSKAITLIVMMNLVFSFDSILGAIALAGESFAIMAIAVIISGILMIWLADRVSDFLQKNRMYEVLGLFILLLVGVMLLSEGGELAHLSFFGHEIEAMTKTTFYFVIAVLVLIDIVQGRYQKKLLSLKS